MKNKQPSHQQWFLQYWGRSNTHQQRFAIGLRFGQKFFNVAFCSYLHHQYFNLPAGRQVGQQFRAEDFQIHQHRKALSLCVIQNEHTSNHNSND
jgi:hypothetical protein